MKRHRSVAVPVGTALGVALAVPTLAPAAWADGAPASVTIDSIVDSGFDEAAAFDAAWSSTDDVLYTGESHDGGTVAFAADGSLALSTSDSTSSQAFGLVPAHVAFAALSSEPTLDETGADLGLQLRGDADGDGRYDADDYFTLVRYGQDDWRLSKASGTVAKGLDPGDGHHALTDWQAALSAATIQDVGVSLGSGAPSQSATLSSLTFAGTTYTFHAPLPFTTTTAKVTGPAVVGGTLTAEPSFAPDAGQRTYTYRWLLDGATIVGATKSTYTPVVGDLGHAVSVEVTATADGYETATATSDAVTIDKGTFSTAAPTISGTAKVDSTLTANPGTWSPTATFTYRWLRGTTTVGTGKTYKPTSSDNGQKISVSVTGSATGYTTATTTSAQVTVGAASFTTQPTPTISGTVRVGTSVKADPGTWAPGASFTYQWKVNGSSVKGATHSTYTPAASDRGKELTVTVTATRSGYTAVTKKSGYKTVGYGVLSAKTPTISGTHEVGHTLTAHRGTWSPTPSYSYRWKRNGASIKGATHSTYKLTSADKGKKITVTVTAKKTGYTTRSVTSASVTATVPFTKTYAPTITGTARVLSTLTAHVKTWSPKPSKSYQWLRDGKAISGATHSTYKLSASDHGHKVSVRVTGKKSAYTTTTRTSSKTATVAWPKGISTPKITASPKSTLGTAGTSVTFTAKATGGSLHYQWQSSDDGKHWTNLSGKTSTTLKVSVTTSKNAYYYRLTAKNVAGTATSHTARLFVLSTRLQPYSHYSPFPLYNWGAAFTAKTQYIAYSSTKTLVVSQAIACYTGSGSASPWSDLDVEYVGSNGTHYDDGYVFLDGDIWDTKDVESGGCTDPFYTVALVPNSVVSGGVWAVTDTSDWQYTVTQYARP